MKTSWTLKNQGRRCHGLGYYGRPDAYDYSARVNLPPCSWYKSLINGVVHKANVMEKRVPLRHANVHFNLMSFNHG